MQLLLSCCVAGLLDGIAAFSVAGGFVSIGIIAGLTRYVTDSFCYFYHKFVKLLPLTVLA